MSRKYILYTLKLQYGPLYEICQVLPGDEIKDNDLNIVFRVCVIV